MDQLGNFLGKLFDTSGWPARWHCGTWTEFHGWLYIISDLLIWSSYFAIPLVILRYVQRKAPARFSNLYILFAAFILACGATHLLDAVAFWYPAYRLIALVKFITGVISWITVYYLVKTLPMAYSLRTSAELNAEIEQRKLAELTIADLNRQLEDRIAAKTEEVGRNEQRFKGLFEHSFDLVSLMDRDLVTRYRSLSSKRITGWTDQERNARPYLNFIHPDDHDQFKAVVDEVLSYPNKPYPIGMRMKHKAGHYIWLDGTMTNMLNDPAINGIVANLRDVSELRAGNENLELQRKYTADILERITDGVIALDQDFRFTYVNKQVGLMTTRSPESLLGKCVWDEFPLSVGSPTWDAFHKALREQQYLIAHDYYEEFNLWQEFHIYPSKDGLFVFVRDISKQKADALKISDAYQSLETAQKLLVESKASLNALFDNTQSGYILIAPDLTVITFNQRAVDFTLRQFGKHLQRGTPGLEYFPEERRTAIGEMLKLAMKGKKTGYEINYPQSDGSFKWFCINYAGILDAPNSVIGIVMEISDINHRKLAEIEKDLVTTDLIKRNMAMQQFTYIISHNLRAPVASILGLSYLLREGGLTSEENSEIHDALGESATNLDRIVIDLNQILQVTEDDSEQQTEVSLSTMMQGIQEAMAGLLKDEQATLTYDFSSADSLNVMKSHLYSILYHLILNGIKFKRKGVPPVITIISEHSGSWLLLHIRDNGEGIDMEKHEKQLFSLYNQVNPKTHRRGKGLFMVKTHLDILNGSVSLTSKKGEGTTFTISLPA